MTGPNNGEIAMDVLIVKVAATGDVVRTTPLLRRFSGHVTWVTAAGNGSLLEGIGPTFPQKHQFRPALIMVLSVLRTSILVAAVAQSILEGLQSERIEH